MVECACLGNALSYVDLRFETRYARICCVWICHHTANTTSDLLSVKQFGVSDSSSFFLRCTLNSFVINILVLIEFKILSLPVDFRLEKNIVFAFFLLVNLH